MYHGATGLAGPRTLITSRSERPNLPALREGRRVRILWTDAEV
jgi:hypothetical protein